VTTQDRIDVGILLLGVLLIGRILMGVLSR
jgi:hypothetical protein